MGGDIEILIVEDSHTQAELLKFMLADHGWRVIVATNGEKGLALARERKPALVISDIEMPVMNGYELCRAIKEDHDLCHMPVILFTSWTDQRAVLRGLEAQADYFLTKPVEKDLLLARVTSVLSEPLQEQKEPPGRSLEIILEGERYLVTAQRHQILSLLLSTHANAVHSHRELIKTKSELACAKQANNRFLAGINTELRMPLNAIISSAGSLLLKLPGPLNHDQENQLRNIEKNARDLLSFINGFVDSANLESGKIKPPLESIIR